MFNDRDLAVIGSGAVLSIFCLLLPVSFASKIAIGLIVLVISMVFALLRFGGDRLTAEEWLKRRLRFYLRPKTWAFHERKLPRPRSPKQSTLPQVKQDRPHVQDEKPAVVISLHRVPGEKIARILLMMVSVYFLYGLWTGDAADIAALIKGVLP